MHWSRQFPNATRALSLVRSAGRLGSGSAGTRIKQRTGHPVCGNAVMLALAGQTGRDSRRRISGLVSRDSRRARGAGCVAVIASLRASGAFNGSGGAGIQCPGKARLPPHPPARQIKFRRLFFFRRHVSMGDLPFCRSRGAGSNDKTRKPPPIKRCARETCLTGGKERQVIRVHIVEHRSGAKNVIRLFRKLPESWLTYAVAPKSSPDCLPAVAPPATRAAEQRAG